ncbi:MAG: HD-GYP domain-containing protein [Acidobacteria bacterium]|nr:HD-GYP domain-containing protein [Acidobacteriota bacterium]
MDAKSPFTYHHSVRVAETAESMARHLGMEPESVVRIRRAALLHDIGKLFVPDAVLHKKEGLTQDELDTVREHASLTEEILRCVGAFSDLATMAGRHHERLDGSGYPRGLTSEDLTLEDRIIAVADFYSAMTENRPYHQAISHEDAMAVLQRYVPHKLDAACVLALATVRGGGIPVA